MIMSRFNRIGKALAVDAVWCEPLSAAKFPLTGKNTGNLPTETASVFDIRQYLWSCWLFCPILPLSEQGIFRRVTGN
jgi:hypothetical protein